MNKSAGIIIILNKSKVLLCRSSNSILSSTYSFQRRRYWKGEKKIDAAIREYLKRPQLLLPKKQIINRKEPIVINYINKKGFNYKRVYLYKVYK
jgi:hypothetical protein